ncbi:MAG: aldo/keto reductase [Bacteroidales bacterium]|jgi:predicted aldo/keto reductase-like oxidoreductase|nr:aldo/keto reductase [Bacteroidales bacterium]
MKNRNRRDFLKKSLIGISGAALLPSSAVIASGVEPIRASAAELPSRLLGRTGIKTPLISMGTGGATTPAFVRSAYDSGIRLFFSATYYGEGNNEKLAGEGLKGLPRDTFVVGTAAWPAELDSRTGVMTGGYNAESYMKKAEESLKRFGLDYIDILLLPYASKKETVMHDGILRTLEQIRKQGKARFIGIASHSGTEEALNAASSAGIYDLAMISYNYKIQNKQSLDFAVSNAVKSGMGIIAMKTTAGASRQKSGPPLNTDAALKWVLQNEKIGTIVSGMSSQEELKKNLSMIQNLKMTEQELKDLNLAAIESGTGLYCQQCNHCVPQCPHNIDIPTLMRSYMYAYGYKNLEQAWHTLAEARLADNPCDRCVKCNVICSAGFDVKNKIQDIARLKHVPMDFIVG